MIKLTYVYKIHKNSVVQKLSRHVSTSDIDKLTELITLDVVVYRLVYILLRPIVYMSDFSRIKYNLNNRS